MLPRKGIVIPNVEKLKWPPESAYLRIGEIGVAEFGQSTVSPCTFKGPNSANLRYPARGPADKVWSSGRDQG
jgi:hypothetical protein